ncbi:MAG TPA: SDR family oxidoreductase, partial [Sphingomonadales bacterium]|nr:SDR family oxidoreductase [Sphingomonadales bacterium]
KVDNTKEALLIFGATGTLGRALVSAAKRSGSFNVVAAGFRHRPQGDFNFQLDVLGPELSALPDRLAKMDLRVAAVVNCIGGTRDDLILRSSIDDWNRVMDLNLRSAFRIARAFLPGFIARRRGHFIFLGSHSGSLGRAGQASYAAAKAGLIGLTQTLAREYGRRSIQANAVLPGALEDSPSVQEVPAEERAKLLAENVLGGPSNPDEVAGFILHLLTMKKVSGQVFALDSRALPTG